MEEKTTRGGARRDSGRKLPPTKVRMNFTIKKEIALKLESEKNKSALVEKLLRQYYNI